MPEACPQSGVPPADVEITAELVSALLAEQHPDLASGEVRLHGNGWDNATFLVGFDLAARLPRRDEAVELILKEQRWLPEIARLLPGLVPVPARTGVAGSGYPWPWSVVPWIPGRDAVETPLPFSAAATLGRTLRRLHQPGPPDAPRNPFRGIPLSSREPSVEPRLDRIDFSEIGVHPEAVKSLWHQALAVPVDTDDVWIHGDLHPRNIIVDNGKLSAIVDWGDVCVGDPATDLGAAWLLFGPDGQSELRRGYGPIGSSTWERARGWAISFAVLLIDSGAGYDEAWAEVGRRTLERVCR